MPEPALTIDPVAAPARPPARRAAPRRWPGVLLVGAAVLAAYVAIALIGLRQDAHDERILGVLSPLFLWIRDAGGAARDWLQQHRNTVALIGTGLLAAVAGAALAATRRRAWPVVLLCTVFALAAWAQAAMQSDATTRGMWLYLAAASGAFVLGLWCPLRRLAAIPSFPPDRRAPAAAGLAWGWECALVLGLTLVALVLRTWALTELYDFFDLETIDWIIEGRTWNGFLSYLDFGFVQNNGGAVQLLPTQLVFRLFGTSIFTLRMTSVLWSIAAVPLMYWLGRRVAGVTAGVLAALFIVTAPEQLFWARNENLHFAPIAICALITAHLTLWMVERLAPLAVLLVALWMPWCRWFYSASMVAFLIPIAAAGHALAFARGLWRKAWYVVPLLAAGLVFWIFSLTLMRAAVHPGPWQFVDPAAVYGDSAWRKQGEFHNASIPQLLALQAQSMSKNFAVVLGNLTHQTDNLSHWCQRSQPGEHRTILNVGLSMVLLVGLGYLLAQFPDRRAFVLLAWWGISVLPAILSQDPADRRMAMVFPAIHAIAGTALAAFLALLSERGGRIAAALGSAVAAMGIAAILFTNLASHFMLPINPVLFSDYPRFTRAMLEGSDAIFTNVPGPFRSLAVFGNLDRFLERPPCIEAVDPDHWLITAFNPSCSFKDSIYHITVGDRRADELRQRYLPKRVSYLLTDDPSSAPHIALLRALHPDVPVERHPVPRAERALAAMTVTTEQIERLRPPSIISGDPNASPLAGVPLRREPAPADATGETAIAGGILVEHDGWYRWRLDPPCSAAQLTLDGVPVAGAVQPMLAGVHPFTLTLPSATSCAPLRVAMDSIVPPHTDALGAERYVSRAVAALPEVRAPAAQAFDGYAPPVRVLQFPVRPVDFGVDANGNITVLLREAGDRYAMHRYDASGHEIASWPVPVPLTINPGTMAVAPDGTTAVLVQKAIQLYAPDGRLITTWEHPWFVWESQLAFWGDNLVANIHHRNAMAVFSKTGTLIREFTKFEGGPGELYAPMSFTIGRDGALLIQQLDGRALRFQLDGPEFQPRFVEEFRTDASIPGAGFDGPERVLIPTERGVHVFGRGGVRLIASDPARDPSQLPFSASVHIRRSGDRLFVLDSDRNTLWSVPG
jgi:hypothetical protein